MQIAQRGSGLGMTPHGSGARSAICGSGARAALMWPASFPCGVHVAIADSRGQASRDVELALELARGLMAFRYAPAGATAARMAAAGLSRV